MTKRLNKILANLSVQVVYDYYSSPVGELLLLVANNQLEAVLWQH